LPIKDREVATRIRRCPECKAELGVTSYGTRFRVTAAKRVQMLTPRMFLSACISATAVMVGAALLFVGMLSGNNPPREKPMAVIQPVVMVNPEPVPAPFVDEIDVAPFEAAPFEAAQKPQIPPVPPELLAIPEVALEDPVPRHVNPQKAIQDQRDLIGQIRRENAAKQDGFLLAQMDRREELRGLPFIMGDDCKLGVARARELSRSVREVRTQLDLGFAAGPAVQRKNGVFWKNTHHESRLAALAQILATEDAVLRREFAAHLFDTKNSAAGVLLARSAIFDPSDEVRAFGSRRAEGT